MQPMRCLGALLATLLLASSALAELKITGELTVPANRLVRLRAEGDVKEAALVWDVFPEEQADIEEMGTRLLFAAPAGAYRIKLRALRTKDGGASVETARVTVVIGEPPPPVPPPPPGPPVPPGPGPTPPPPTPPDPAPVPVAKAWVVIIEETADALPERGRWLGDPELRKYVAAKGWRFRVADKDTKDKEGNTPADLKPYIERAAGKGYPQVYVVDQDGKVRHEGPLPKTPADLLTTLKKIGG
jgi:hypothetical protein